MTAEPTTPAAPRTSPSGPTTPHTFPVLDTLRAVGALLVVVTHCAFTAGAYTRMGWFGPLTARADVGVALFFVLSGFLLSRQWFVRGAAGSAPPSLRRYAVHRFLRIVPAYLVVALAALLLLPSNDGLGVERWLTTLTLTDIYVHTALPYGLTQTWSLVTEVAFYVVLPALMALVVVRRRLRPARVLVLLLGMVLVTVLWLLTLSGRVPGHPARVNEWLPAYLLWFAAGIGLAHAQVTGTGSALLRRVASSPGSCWLGAFAVLLVATTPVAGPTALVPATTGQALSKNVLYVLVAVLVVLPGVFGPTGSAYHRLMSHRTLRHLGAISYSLFLVHMPVLQFVTWVTGYPLFGGHLPQLLGLTLLISLPLAELLYRLVEVPALRVRGRFDGSATRTRSAPSTSTTA